jgi:O-antigen/teichoic acid export membrane protein
VLTSSFAVTSALNYAFGIALAWVLVPEDFGWLAFVQTALLVCGWILQTGLPWYLARETAAGASDGDAACRGVLVANVALALVLGAILIASYALGLTAAAFHTLGTAVATAATLPFIAIAATGRGRAQGSGRFGASALVQAGEVALRVVFGSVVALLGGGVVEIVMAFVAAAMLASLLSLLLGLPVAIRRLIGPMRRPDLRAVLPTFGGLLGVSLLLTLDLIALALIPGDRATVGYYQACLVLANAPFYLVTSAFVPVLVHAAASAGSLRAARPALTRTVQLALLVAVPLELVLALFPHQALALTFPTGYATLAGPLRVLAAGNAALVLVSIMVATFQAVGQPRIGAQIVVTVVVLEPAALAIAVPRYGATGAAATFLAAAAAALLGLAFRYARTATDAPASRAVARWCVRYASGIAVLVVAAALARGAGAAAAGLVLLPLAAYTLALAPLRLVLPARTLHLRTRD